MYSQSLLLSIRRLQLALTKDSVLKNSEFQPVLFMVGSMALFSLEDFFIKLLSSTMPASQIMVIMGLSGSIIFLFLLLFQSNQSLAETC